VSHSHSHLSVDLWRSQYHPSVPTRSLTIPARYRRTASLSTYTHICTSFVTFRNSGYPLSLNLNMQNLKSCNDHLDFIIIIIIKHDELENDKQTSWQKKGNEKKMTFECSVVVWVWTDGPTDRPRETTEERDC
jgi:hypothetical protein